MSAGPARLLPRRQARQGPDRLRAAHEPRGLLGRRRGRPQQRRRSRAHWAQKPHGRFSLSRARSSATAGSYCGLLRRCTHPRADTRPTGVEWITAFVPQRSASWLFADHDPDGTDATRTSPVEPARPSDSTRAKAGTKRTPERSSCPQLPDASSRPLHPDPSPRPARRREGRSR